MTANAIPGYRSALFPLEAEVLIRRLSALSRTTLSMSFGKPSGVSASISSVSVILVPRTRSSSLRIDWAILLTCGVGRLG
jgi:hypothetical protein